MEQNIKYFVLNPPDDAAAQRVVKRELAKGGGKIMLGLLEFTLRQAFGDKRTTPRKIYESAERSKAEMVRSINPDAVYSIVGGYVTKFE